MKQGMIVKPEIPEMCRDEIRDFVLELIRHELQRLPEDQFSRRRELCTALLAANPECGERARIAREAVALIRDWRAQEIQISGLERLGFTVTKGRKHYKVRWRGSGYFKTLSTTPSDFRTGANGESQFLGTFF